MDRVRGDRGDIVLGWLTKLVALLGVLGVIGFDVISLGQAHYQAADRAATAAAAASTEYASSKNTQRAFDAAYGTLGAGDTIETTTFSISPEGAVKLRLHHKATTLIVEKIGPIRDWTDVTSTGQARPPT